MGASCTRPIPGPSFAFAPRSSPPTKSDPDFRLGTRITPPARRRASRLPAGLGARRAGLGRRGGVDGEGGGEQLGLVGAALVVQVAHRRLDIRVAHPRL